MIWPTPRHWLPLSGLLILSTVSYLTLSNYWPDISTLSPSYSTAKHTFHAPYSNLWAELTQQEANDVYDFLFHTQTQLNLTQHPTHRVGENYVHLIEILRPNKSDTTPYLDESLSPPRRFVHLITVEQNGRNPRVGQYMVGPLPVNEKTQIQPLQYCFTANRNYVNVPMASEYAADVFVSQLLESVNDVLDEVIGFKYNALDPFGPDSVRPVVRIIELSNSSSIGWLSFFGSGSRSGEWSLQQHGLYAKLRIYTVVSQDWDVLQWAYNGIMYDSIEDLRQAMQSPGFVKLPKSTIGPWADMEDFDSNPTG